LSASGETPSTRASDPPIPLEYFTILRQSVQVIRGKAEHAQPGTNSGTQNASGHASTKPANANANEVKATTLPDIPVRETETPDVCSMNGAQLATRNSASLRRHSHDTNGFRNRIDTTADVRINENSIEETSISAAPSKQVAGAQSTVLSKAPTPESPKTVRLKPHRYLTPMYRRPESTILMDRRTRKA